MYLPCYKQPCLVPLSQHSRSQTRSWVWKTSSMPYIWLEYGTMSCQVRYRQHATLEIIWPWSPVHGNFFSWCFLPLCTEKRMFCSVILLLAVSWSTIKRHSVIRQCCTILYQCDILVFPLFICWNRNISSGNISFCSCTRQCILFYFW